MKSRLRWQNLAAASRTEEVPLLVDTGATLSWIPKGVLDKSGLAPVSRVAFSVADGRELEREVTLVLLAIDGKRVAFGEPHEAAVLGATALESLGLLVDPIGQKLLPRKLLALCIALI